MEAREAIVDDIEKHTTLGRAGTLEDVGNVAAFAASDRARTMTAATASWWPPWDSATTSPTAWRASRTVAGSC